MISDKKIVGLVDPFIYTIAENIIECEIAAIVLHALMKAIRKHLGRLKHETFNE